MKRLIAFALVLSACSSSQKKEPSLYDRLGGAHAIACVVDDFVDRLFANPTVMANPVVKEESGKVSRAGLKFQLTALVCQVTGGPHKYHGRTMPDSHTGMGIAEAEWDAMAADFRITLDKFKVPEKEQKELFDIVGSVKPDVVKGPKTSGTRTPMPKSQGDSLYARLGDVCAVAEITEQLIFALAVNETLKANQPLCDMLVKTPKAVTLFQTALILCEMSGGPYTYHGRSLKEAHARLNISEKEWISVIDDFRNVLAKCKVPEREAKEFVAIVEKAKGDIVTTK